MNYKFKPLYDYEAWRKETHDAITKVCEEYHLDFTYDTILTAEEAIILKIKCPYLDFIPVINEV